MYFFPSEEPYRYVSIIFDGFAGLIFLITLVTLWTMPKEENKKIKRYFGTSLVFGILASYVDMGSYTCWNKNELHSQFKFFSYCDSLFFSIFIYFVVKFIMQYVDKTNLLNRIIYYINKYVLMFLSISLAIWPIQQLIYTVPEDAAVIEGGPLQSTYVMFVSVALLLTTFLLLINIKQVGFRDTILLLAMEVIPVMVYCYVWPEEPVLLFLLAVFLLVCYLIIYQGRIWRIADAEKEIVDQKSELTNMKTKLVLSQVQPHFMYNTLSSIAYYCKKDPDLAQKLTVEFSSYLRSNIDALDSSNNIMFSKELDHIKNYLQIEKIRFGDRIRDEYDIQVSDFTIPALLVQPIVENAVKHGVCKKEDGGTVKISTYKTEKYIVIAVEDNGVGFDQKNLIDDGRSHIGIVNVRERLESICKGVMIINSEIGKGTMIKMYIPRSENEV